MATFGRLLGFLRPYRTGVVWSGLLAVVALTMTAAIPWLTGRAIDQMRDGDSTACARSPSPSSPRACCGWR